MRYLGLALAAVLVVSSTGVAHAYETKKEWRWAECRFQTRDGRSGFSDKEVKLTIRCAVKYYPVPGGVAQALYIADRESHFNEFAHNSYSSASGVYQFLPSTWERVKNSMSLWWQDWELHHSVFNARANSLAAVRYASLGGWGPWGY